MKVRKEDGSIVIDNGSATIKVGFSGEASPRFDFPTRVGKPSNLIDSLTDKEFFVGDETVGKTLGLKLSYPIHRGLITNWESMEKIWTHAFYSKLNVDPTKYAILYTEPPLNPKASREKLTQLAFDQFNCAAIYVCTQALLGLYASGRTTGVVLDSGFGATQVVPVYEGYPLPHAYETSPIAGNDITDYLLKRLKLKEEMVNYEAADSIKEGLCYIAANCEIEKLKIRTFELLDGSLIEVGKEQFECPELLFNPSLAEKQGKSIANCIVDSVMNCEADFRSDMFQNIVLCGGSTLFKGLVERLKSEIGNVVPTTVEVVAAPDGKYSVWVGGSILTSLSTFCGMWISNAEYQRSGPTIVNRKCF